jgi:hypothetical protein
MTGGTPPRVELLPRGRKQLAAEQEAFSGATGLSLNLADGRSDESVFS